MFLDKNKKEEQAPLGAKQQLQRTNTVLQMKLARRRCCSTAGGDAGPPSFKEQTSADKGGV